MTTSKWILFLIAAVGQAQTAPLEDYLRTGYLMIQQGNYVEAETVLLKTLEKVRLLKQDESLPVILNNLCIVTQELNKTHQAESYCRQCLLAWEKQLGPEHSLLADPINNLAGVYLDMGFYSKAEPLYQRALAIKERAFGPDHPEVAKVLSNLGYLNYWRTDFVRAETFFRRALAIQSPDAERAALLDNLANVFRAQGKRAEALRAREEALSLMETALGAAHVRLASVLANLAVDYLDQRRYKDAEPLLLRARGISETNLGADHPATGEILMVYAGLLRKTGRKPEGAKLEQTAKAILEGTEQGRSFRHVIDASSLRQRSR
jgi:tetratricopeptide (TPR) repeat protein